MDSANVSRLDRTRYCELLRHLSDTITTDNISIERITGCDNIYIFIYGELEDPMGSITCIIEPKIIHDGASVAHVEDVVVHPRARGQGIATALVRHVRDFAREEQCYKMLLHCHPSLADMYRSMGFSNENLVGMRCNL